MASIDYRSGCKVAWETFDNEDEAKAASEKAKLDAERKVKLGYDFGYQWPGEIRHVEKHATLGVECWVVTLP